MPENYTKPWLSIDEQLAKLRQRGMVVSDPAKSRDYLERIGYYRLSGYWFAFRERSELCCALNPAALGKHERSKPGRLPLDQFKPGASFENAVDLYVFDKKLRLMAMDALERIEISPAGGYFTSFGRASPFCVFAAGTVSRRIRKCNRLEDRSHGASRLARYAGHTHYAVQRGLYSPQPREVRTALGHLGGM
jgi:hypothetical protein